MSFKPDITPEVNPENLRIKWQQVELAELGGQVKRYHAKITLKEETVAEHSYYVAWLIKFLSEGVPSATLLLAGLQHDNAEYVTGDMPGPTKRDLKIVPEFEALENRVLNDHYQDNYQYMLTPAEARTLEIADSMAGMFFCIKERMLGNKYIIPTYQNYRTNTDKIMAGVEKTRQEKELLLIIDTKWKNANE